ncbi:hypothetical protein EUGRSUZ_G01405 [Eucalyptus grandis]|uniref:Uncharacterized protein n=2 Tax=Eucalyptus grandis TaxID=71139 RepID=A0ACC3K3R5_EUCGR|nr:hypothetical protein EUGRSUZ_G01405 [Eucalyptus grandis]
MHNTPAHDHNQPSRPEKHSNKTRPGFQIVKQLQESRPLCNYYHMKLELELELMLNNTKINHTTTFN